MAKATAAKNTGGTLTSTKALTPPSPGIPGEGEGATASTATDELVGTAVVEIPVWRGEVPGYAGTRVLRDLSTENAGKLNRVRLALVEDNRLLASGKPIQSSDDALAWLLEQLDASN